MRNKRVTGWGFFKAQNSEEGISNGELTKAILTQGEDHH